jgi:DNA-directed RNA polymerase subunit M/transcription elongation factor TFIIS
MINNLFWPVLIFIVICRLLWALLKSIWRGIIAFFASLFDGRNSDAYHTVTTKPAYPKRSEDIRKDNALPADAPSVSGKIENRAINTEKNNTTTVETSRLCPRCGDKMDFYVEVARDGKEESLGRYRCRYCAHIRDGGYTGPIEEVDSIDGAAEGLEYGKIDDYEEQIVDDDE